jgi:hypothetical protein
VNFEDNSKDLSDFFSTISVGKQKRKKQLEESVGDSVDCFFQTISIGKKIEQEKKESLVGDSFETLFLSKLKEDKKPTKKKKQKQISEENFSIENPIKEIQIKETIKSTQTLDLSLVEGLLREPPSVKNSDPLTPLNQTGLGIERLEKKFNLFVNRVQEQLSTLGGGGETNLTYMDVPITSVITSSYAIKLQDYYIGVNYAGAVTITLPKADREGKIFVIKDELGEASKGSNRYITIIPSGIDLIDGRDRAILAFDYGSLTFIWKDNSWRVI